VRALLRKNGCTLDCGDRVDSQNFFLFHFIIIKLLFIYFNEESFYFDKKNFIRLTEIGKR
jgi:hypothetical protein